MQSKSTLREELSGLLRELPWPFRKKVTEAEEVSQLGCVDPGNRLQSKRRALKDRFRRLAQDKLLLPAVPLVASLMGTLRI